MAGNLFYLPRQVPLNSGVVVPGAKATFTLTGTTTPQNTYTDIDLTTPHANPVVADSEGEFAPIYFDPSFDDYRLKLTDSDDVLIYQDDDIPASQSGQSLTLTAAAPFIDLIENDASANNGVWRIAVNGEQLTLKLGNDALSAFTDILTIDRTANTTDAIALTSTALTTSGTFVASGAGAFNGISTPDIKFKTADKSINTNTTVEDDNHLAGWTLDTSGYYILEGWLSYTQNVGNLKFTLQFSNAAVATTRYGFKASDSNAAVHNSGAVLISAVNSITTLADAASCDVWISGLFQANTTTGGTMDLQWAQETSDANNTTLRTGSWISLRKVG